jgi:hypothetical protein
VRPVARTIEASEKQIGCSEGNEKAVSDRER